MGTVPYMSPEQIRAKVLDGRADLFSFGIVLYEMATGRLPFQGSSAAIITETILNRNPLPPTQVNPDIPLALQEVISRALEKDCNLRYQHAADMRIELQRLKRDTESGRRTAQGQSQSGLVPPANRLSSTGKQRMRTSSGQTTAIRPSECPGSLARSQFCPSRTLEAIRSMNTSVTGSLGASSTSSRPYRSCELWRRAQSLGIKVAKLTLKP